MYSRDREIDYATFDVANTVQPVLEENLRQMAEEAGWPENIIRSLRIEFDGNNLVVDYPKDLDAEIDDLEYGKPFGLPNPVIEPFKYRCGDLIENIILTRTLDFLFESEGMF